MKNKNVEFLATAAMIAALYVVITVAFAPIGFGEIQFRISEALTILPFFTPAAVPGLFIGCLIGNILGGAVIPDVIFGSLATLIGAFGTYLIGRKRSEGGQLIKATIPPILANALIIPFVLKYAYGSPLPIPVMVLTVGLGEVISCGILGSFLGKALEKNWSKVFK
ncbi:MAG: QueT transporter family protein [Firmicutes bacterium]|nr:QueT transporter family protein [Bacillota bacterium]